MTITGANPRVDSHAQHPIIEELKRRQRVLNALLDELTDHSTKTARLRSLLGNDGPVTS